MKKVIVFLSHKITELQKKELEEKYHINTFIFLSEELQNIWSDVKCDEAYYMGIEKMKVFMQEHLKAGDYIIAQGNWGYVYEVVTFAKKNNITALYSFSYRDSEEEILNGESIKVSRYRHIKFIKY